jgi:uncharacterized protein (TIRG00374 family)
VKYGHLWTGIGISLALIIYLFSRVDYGRLWGSLTSANLPLLAFAGALLASTFALRSWRWYYLIRPLKTVGFTSLMAATTIGLMANMIFPARLGEIVRAVVIGQRERIDKSAAFATIIVERLLDGFTILLILGILLLVSPLPLDRAWGQTVRWGGLLTLALYIGVFGFLLCLHHATPRVLHGVQRLSSRLPSRWVDKLVHFLDSFSVGLQTLSGRDFLAHIVVTSLILWGAFGLYNFLVVLAFDLHLPLSVGFLLLIFQAFAVMIPSSPGFVGTYHAASVACLSLWGITTEAALSVALVMHAGNFFMTTGLGAGALWGIGVSPRALMRRGSTLQGTPTSSV